MTTSRVYLKENATGKMVAADLHDEVSDTHLAMHDSTWAPAMRAHCAGRTWTDSPQDRNWDWRSKAKGLRPLLGYHSFAVVCQNELQGLMWTNDLHFARLDSQFGKPLVYVEYVATAPWNRTEVQQPRRYEGVGGVFIDAAIQLSLDTGYHGRIGLHSLPKSEEFYETKCGMTPLRIDLAREKLRYFEMTAKQAEAFRLKREV
jgi:hypothetical protein